MPHAQTAPKRRRPPRAASLMRWLACLLGARLIISVRDTALGVDMCSHMG